MSHSPDIVSEITALARQVAGVDDDAAARLAAAIRSAHGGRHVRILEREPITKERIDAELRRGKPVRQIAAEFGAHRATLYKHLKVARKPRVATA